MQFKAQIIIGAVILFLNFQVQSTLLVSKGNDTPLSRTMELLFCELYFTVDYFYIMKRAIISFTAKAQLIHDLYYVVVTAELCHCY